MEKTINVCILKRTADGYLAAGKCLLDTQKNGVSFFAYYISPCAVNLAFACELYLKYLYAMTCHDLTVQINHKLLDLYHKLPEKTQLLIKADYLKWTSILNFDECLEKHNLTFKQFRYIYEMNPLSVEPQSLYNLAISLKNTCLRLQEESQPAD